MWFTKCLIGNIIFVLFVIVATEKVAPDIFENDKSNKSDENVNFILRHNKFKNPNHLFSNQNKEFFDDNYENFGDFRQHPCRRVCQDNQVMTCYYKLMVHNYQRLGSECNRCLVDPKACEAERCIYGDGVPTSVFAVNYKIPGPSIEVCENDTIVVDVLNQLTDMTTMHWHGIHMIASPESDGAPYVTQYSIQPSEVFRYVFNADRFGTLWYHSHVGWQRAFGVAGQLVVRQNYKTNRHAHLYDYDLIEHTLLIHDISYNNEVDGPKNILINGKGRNFLNSLPDNDPRFRYELLNVTPGYRYRMRVISNGVFNCPIEFSIENHRMLIIATDGNDIEPVWADSFFLSSAERIDFVLWTNQKPNNFWIKVRGLNFCKDINLYQGAVLHYRGTSRNALPNSTMSIFDIGYRNTKEHTAFNFIQEYPSNVLHKEILQSNDVATVDIRSLDPLPWPRYTKFKTFYGYFGIRTKNGRVNFQIDDITYETPGISLLQARNLFDEDTYFCNRSSLLANRRDCTRENCECINVQRVPAYQPIEMVVTNLMSTTHPFHLHGYTVRLVGQDVIGSKYDLRRIRELDSAGLLKRLPDNFPAVEKDTIQIPGFGYIIIRFMSDNPGYWLYHCHIEQHAVQGMMAVLKVGENYEMRRLKPKIRC